MSYGEHTSKSIIGSKGNALKDRKIVLGVTGSVAAIKSSEISRELMRQGADITVVMTHMAQKIVHPYTLEWSTGNPVITELTGQIEHVQLGGEHPDRADLILIAPSTANTISKAATGIDDTPVTTLLTTAIGADIPIIIAPAMHASMYKHPIINENIEKLQSIGIKVLMPRMEEEKAKIPGTKEIVEAVIKRLTDQDLKGVKILISAGPAREYLDSIRFISNPSSGKMGMAIAEVALRRGAEVTVVYGRGNAEIPSGTKVVNVVTTEEMLDAVVGNIKTMQPDIVILAAAAADYKPSERPDVKVPSKQPQWNIELRPLPKIIERVKKVKPDTFLVGFKAEYNITDEELIRRASKRMKEAVMDIVVANDVARDKVGFNTDTNEVFIIDKQGKVLHVPVSDKTEVAEKLLTLVKGKMK